jgi:serine/threonine protein kinase/tetratricopeptide (TPR) repeat protein
MNASRHRVTGSDSHLVQVLDGYLAALQSGTAPDKEELLAQYPELAEDLEACLASLDFIRQAAVKPAVGEPGLEDADSPNRVLGDYRIVREVGRGGMGIVYEAEQVSLARRVALKVLPFAATLDPKQLQRFKNEAQAAAQLHHTNIVPVYGVGCERGVHYYAMQFIEGETLAEVIHQLRLGERGCLRTPASPVASAPGDLGALTQPRSPAERPTSPVTALYTERAINSSAFFRTVANLGVQAAEAVEHAHQLGVVHRDIKPANLLVDVRGNLWITDFGLAQFQSNAGLTLSGDIVGTLRYMSPEQALAKRSLIDHRTDIYSLGVTLYELLTLEPAFAGRDREELLRQITFEEPRSARRLNQAIPTELETIVGKAIEKNPAERYATAQELADDLRRFLEDKPILAKRPTLVHRARKWARRHRPLVAAAAAVVAVVTLSLGALVWREKDRVEAEKTLLEAANQKLETEKERDKANLRLAMEALDKVYLQALEQSAPRDPAKEKEYRQLMQNTLHFYEAFARQNGAEPEVRWLTGRAYLRAANLHNKLGQHHQAAEACTRAIPLYEQLRAEFPHESDYLDEHAACYYTLGRALWVNQKLPDSEKAYRRAVSLGEELLAEPTVVPRYRVNQAKNYNALGLVLADLARHADAEEAYHQSLTLAQALVREFPEVRDYQRALAEFYNNLGSLFRTLKRVPEGDRAYHQALLIWEKLAASPDATAEDRRLVASIHYNRGPFLRALGRYDEAETAYHRAIQLYAQLGTDFPAVHHYQRFRANACGNLGYLFSQTGRLAEAEKAYREALVLHQDLADRFPNLPQTKLDLAQSYTNLAGILEDLDRPADAERPSRDALVLREELVAKYPQVPQHQMELLTAYTNLAGILVTLEQMPEAGEKVHKAVERCADNPEAKLRLARLLAFHRALHRPYATETVELAKAAVERLPQKADGWTTLGVAHYRSADYPAAIAAIEKALPLRSGGDSFEFFFLAMTHWQQGDKDKARQWYDRAVAWMERHRPGDEQFRRYRAEAAALLGLPDPAMPTGKEARPQKKSAPD